MENAGWTFDAIGTRWHIDLPDTTDEALKTRALRAVLERIAIFDKDYSRFREDSWVTQLSRAAGTYTMPADAAPLFSLYEDLYHLTDGAFTPLIGKTLEEAGYDAHYSLTPKTLTPVAGWDDVLRVDFPTLTLRQPALLDFGAGGKGYLIDIVGGVLRDMGIASFCIDAGHDLLYAHPAQQALRVGLENPFDARQVIGVAEIPPSSMCGSSGNRRTWANFHHTINPHTLASPQHIVATWTIAPTALLADALSTCLFFVPPEILLARYDFAYCLLFPDMSIQTSPNFPAEFFYASH